MNGGQTYFNSIAWDEVTANLERTPLYARQLEKQTRPPKAQPAGSAELFTFALDPDWKEKLDPHTLEKILHYRRCVRLLYGIS